MHSKIAPSRWACAATIVPALWLMSRTFLTLRKECEVEVRLAGDDEDKKVFLIYGESENLRLHLEMLLLSPRCRLRCRCFRVPELMSKV